MTEIWTMAGGAGCCYVGWRLALAAWNLPRWWRDVVSDDDGWRPKKGGA